MRHCLGQRRCRARQCARRPGDGGGSARPAAAAIGARRSQGARARRLPGAAPGGHGSPGEQSRLDGANARRARPRHRARHRHGHLRQARSRARELALRCAGGAGGDARRPSARGRCLLGSRAQPLEPAAAEAVLACVARGPQALDPRWTDAVPSRRSRPLERLEAATGVPSIGMESPRGLNDPRLGAFAEVLRMRRSRRSFGQSPRFHAALWRCALPCPALPVCRHRSRRPHAGAARR